MHIGSDALFKIGKLILLNNEFRSLLGELIDISQEIFTSVSSKAGDSLTNAGSGLQNDENHPNKHGKGLVDKYLDKALDPNKKVMDKNPLQGDHHHTSIPGQEDHHRRSIHDQEPRLVSSPQDDPRRQGLLNTGDSVHPNVIPGGFPIANSVDGGVPINEQPLVSQNQQNMPPQGGFAQQQQQQHMSPHTGLGEQLNHMSPQGALGQQPHQQGTLGQQGVLGQHNDPLNQHAPGARVSQGENYPTDEYKQKIESHPMYQKSKNEIEEQKHHARHTVKEKLPKEKQDELISRLRLSLAQVQKHPEYQSAIRTLMQLVKVWSQRVSQVTGTVKTQAKEGDRPDQANARERAERELKTIIECWAQGYSIDPLLHGVQDVVRDMQHDDQLRDLYKQFIHYADRLVSEPGYVQRDESTKDGRRLMDQGNHMIKGKYREHLNFLSSESRKFINLMAEDDISKELNHRVATIHRDLWMDGEGNPAFKPHLLNDMRMTLLPAFIDEIKYIPIPRIEYSDPQYDIVIENLVLSGDTLLPNVFETKVDSFNSFSLKSDVKTSPSRQSLYIRMSEIQAEINDVVFYYKKKTGFPKLTDRGVASLSVGGKGISVSLRIQSVTDNPAKTFKVASCKCNVDNLKVKVNESNHDMLYKAIQPLILGSIRKQIARAIEMKITNMLNQGDQKVTNYMVEMNQNLQNKAYQSLPEQEQNAKKPPTVSQARPRPGFLSTLVTIINNNIKTKVQKRNEAKRMERMSTLSPSSTHSSPHRESGIDHLSRDPHHEGGIGHLNKDHHHSPTGLNLDPHQHHDNASVATDRHHFIASPPLSPTSKARNAANAPHVDTNINQQHHQPTSPNHFKLAQDMSDAQQQYQRQQLNQTQP